MKIMICAGGTGGHVYPALAVAKVLMHRGHEVVWMGTPDSFEARVVPQHGIVMELVRVKGLRGKGVIKLLTAPLTLARAMLDAIKVLRRVQPNMVLGMGGFAAGPGGLAAWLSGKPLVIHEQNAAPGLTNRLLARIASKVLQAFPDTFEKLGFKDAITVGNPVRTGFVELASPAARLIAHDVVPRLLVLGGSQGARALNELVPAALALLPEGPRPQVRHQAGRTLDIAKAAYAKAGVDGDVTAFIDDMPAAYDWADLVICRSGASTIAELAAAGSAALLVPFPHAVDDHQTRNGEYLVHAGAAQMIAEAELCPLHLAETLHALLGDRVRLVAMATAARTAAWGAADERIADLCLAAGAAK
ncbi:undecaprenyldiphospho-muramoylpentapeptide beta-N-acetylglucosaminyltransferase [Nevskia sp.]|uniref:undecaprenyldiphospho-muramoylpentapeptide beta-N-acetylglucosaminyltransferase n=1 Tax=Nevskia sp. TaxID=1929292 RepID=UPI0025F41375|nr:undecaprenyldiphospho-muramoylpentapeptide beta-N-acetylglucosaminyltransferase [Nevskia sp.]